MGLRNGAVFVSQQKGLQVHDLLAELGHRGSQCVVLSRKEFNLGLKICQPLFLPLTTLESRNAAIMLVN